MTRKRLNLNTVEERGRKETRNEGNDDDYGEDCNLLCPEDLLPFLRTLFSKSLILGSVCVNFDFCCSSPRSI
jgi:hypothetical protein